jgi:hypothetical protein
MDSPPQDVLFLFARVTAAPNTHTQDSDSGAVAAFGAAAAFAAVAACARIRVRVERRPIQSWYRYYS